MGALRYDGETTEFDDRLLAHLQIVIVHRLRQGKSFTMSWMNALSIGDGRASIWLHPQCHLRFGFDGSRSPTIDPDWLRLLGDSADGPRGLIVTDERGVPVRSTGGAR